MAPLTKEQTHNIDRLGAVIAGVGRGHTTLRPRPGFRIHRRRLCVTIVRGITAAYPEN